MNLQRYEEGTGLISTVVGVAVILVLLMFAAQVMLDLYMRSAVTSVAFDAARVVAGADANSSPDARVVAEAQARRALGHYGSRASFLWTVDPDEVDLSIEVHNQSLLSRALATPLGLDTVRRSIAVRRERVR